MEFSSNYERFNEECTMLRDYDQSNDYCDTEMNMSINVPRVTDRSWFSCLWMCLKVNVECTIVCGVVVGLFATFLWWLDLIIRQHCSPDWEKIPERIYRTHLIVDIVIVLIINFWAFSLIAPLCGWSVSKELNLVCYCIIGGLLDTVDRLVVYIYGHYSKIWRYYVGSVIFLLTSFAICYRFARHCKTALNVSYNTFVLTLKLGLQVVVGFVVSLVLNLLVFELYYKSSPDDRTILACVLIVAFAVPKLFINHIATSIRGICTPGDEIMLSIAYLTGSTVVCRVLQAKINDLKPFIVISLVHGVLNVFDKLLSPLQRRVLSFMCHICEDSGSNEGRSTKVSLFLANQALVLSITETTCVVLSVAAAYLLRHYYEKDEITGQRYDGLALLKDMAMKCGIGIGIEFVFNVVALQIHTYLYNVPIFSVWKGKWKFILISHIIQVMFIVLYFSVPINDVLIRNYYIKANSTCFGFFERV